MAPFEENRAETARIMYDEALRLRDMQDDRINDLRQRSITVMTLVSSAVVIVAGLGAGAVPNGALVVAMIALIAMIMSGVVVHVPIGGYREGPNVDDLHSAQYANADPGYQVMRDVGLYHYEHYRLNNRQVLKWINLGFAGELVFAAIAVISVTAGAAAA